MDLGDSTSRNLEFAHRRHGALSYGEETITEQNLLEIRRRNPTRVYLKTFTKRMEAKNGADWEWHIIGRRLTFKMRVQAKRIRQDYSLRIRYKVKSSGAQQRDSLMSAARADRLRPVYCIYCTEAQREIWNHPVLIKGFRSLQTGCLLADAPDVPEATSRLCSIEKVCVPWHYLCVPKVRSKTGIPDDLVAAAKGQAVADINDPHPQDHGIPFFSVLATAPMASLDSPTACDQASSRDPTSRWKADSQ